MNCLNESTYPLMRGDKQHVGIIVSYQATSTNTKQMIYTIRDLHSDGQLGLKEKSNQV